MRTNRRTVAVATAVLALTGGGAFAAWQVQAVGSGSTVTGTVESVPFQMIGNPLEDKWPGEAGPMVVQYQNPNTRDVTGFRLTARVKSTTASGCPVESFVVTPGADPVALAANTTDWKGLDAKQSPVITIAESAPDACQGVAVHLAFELLPTTGATTPAPPPSVSPSPSVSPVPSVSPSPTVSASPAP